ncbi:MAG: FMN-dependent NADH-azoreductase [Paraglaciecola sp.]|jgi:FMN-dependent NADH-azoreductase
MTKVLVINTSLNGEQGNSNKLTEKFVQQWLGKESLELVNRDLSELNLPHLTSAEMLAWGTAEEQRTAQQKELAAISDQLVAELQACDAIVLGMPMYNFGVPSTFKAWIDRVARAGITFSYTEQGPKGLLSGKKVYILAARGGMYVGTPKDSQSQYLKDVFAFLGMTDVEIVYAEGLAMGADSADKAWHDAEKHITNLLGNLQAA